MFSFFNITRSCLPNVSTIHWLFLTPNHTKKKTRLDIIVIFTTALLQLRYNNYYHYFLVPLR